MRVKDIKVKKPFTSCHICAMEWLPEKIDFAVDDRIFNTFTNENKTNVEYSFDHYFLP